MAERSPSFVTLAILVAIVVVAGGVGGGLLYEHNQAAGPSGPQRVVVGSNVTVDYIGFFGTGAQTGRVFDTSLLSVATNNATYPKSLQFSFRSKGGYVPLGVSVGGSVPSGGYTIDNITFGSVVTGFWQGLLGLAVNESRYIFVSPALGYGSIDPGCLVTAPLTTTVPVLASYSSALFTSTFPDVTANPGVTFADPTYGWTDLILSVGGGTITVENLPALGWTASPHGLPVIVSALNATTITLASQLTVADIGLVQGSGEKSVCSQTQFIVSAVNPENGTYTENYNREVVGQTLIFQVTIVKFY